MNFIINNQEFFLEQIPLYTIFVKVIRIISIDQTPISFVVIKSTFYAGINISNNLPPSITILKNYKANFQAAEENTNIPTPFTLQMNIFMCQDDLSYCF